MKIRNRISLSSSHYTKEEIIDLYSKGLIDICDYLEIKNIEIRNRSAYLDGELIDYYYSKHRFFDKATYFYAKHKGEIVICNIYCGIDETLNSNSLCIYQLDIIKNYHKFKCLLYENKEEY